MLSDLGVGQFLRTSYVPAGSPGETDWEGRWKDNELSLRTIRDGCFQNGCSIGTDTIHAQRELFSYVRQAQDLERQILTDWLRQLIGVTLLELRGNALGDRGECTFRPL